MAGKRRSRSSSTPDPRGVAQSEDGTKATRGVGQSCVGGRIQGSRQDAWVTAADFGDVLCFWGWWDIPRSGVAMIDREPHRFDCQFSKALDDYAATYTLWPIDPAQLDEELALWRRWVDWRSRFDSGQSAEPFEHQPGYEAFRQRLQR